MKRITGPHILAAVLVAFYAVFWFWYGGAGRPLSDAEIQHYLTRFDEIGPGDGTLHVREQFETWMRQDDGNEFLMVNLIDEPADLAAEEEYNRAILPPLLRRASFPVFMVRPFATFIEPEGHHTWDMVAVMRYRSLRDLLEVITGPEADRLRDLKEGSVAKTHVFPTHMVFSFIWVRFIAAALLVALGLSLHAGLRRFGRYRR